MVDEQGAIWDLGAANVAALKAGDLPALQPRKQFRCPLIEREDTGLLEMMEREAILAPH